MNDDFIYPIDVDNSSRHFHNVVSAEGLVPFINREEYAFEGVQLSDTTLNGREQNFSLQGKFFWVATKINRNERVNSRGIEVYFDYQNLPDDTYTQRVFLEVVRFATIEDGYTECYFA